MTDPTISVVINNYNYEPFLADAIESALRQSTVPAEVVVVDDGSTDGSKEVIRRYSDWVTPVLKPNGGQASAFNAGFAAASGDVVIFLDADDMLREHAVERVARAFGEPGLAKVHWTLAEVDISGRPTGRLRPEAMLPAGDLHDAVLAAGPRSYTNPPTSGNAWSRSLLEELLPMPEHEYVICADFYLVSLAPLFGRIGRIVEPQSFWRRHADNQFNSAALTLQERLDADIVRFDHACDVLSDLLRKRSGLELDPAMWRLRNNSFKRMERLTTSLKEIAERVPEGGLYVLADDGDWASGNWEGCEILPRRRSLPFLPRAEAVVPPSDARPLIERLEHLRRAGASHVFFVWPAIWWLQHYPDLDRHVRSTYRCEIDRNQLVGFDLTRSPVEPHVELQSLRVENQRLEREIFRREVVHRVRGVVADTVPADATVLVVSRGDNELADLDGRRAWHFPSVDGGVYAGYHPPSSEDAIRNLEELRARGAEYLLFPCTAFWWLDHYAGFRQHLHKRYAVVAHEEETCLILQLT